MYYKKLPDVPFEHEFYSLAYSSTHKNQTLCDGFDYIKNLPELGAIA